MGTWGTDHVASRAVDGYINPNINDGYCAHPESKDTSKRAWWYVDLEDSYRISNIILFNRQGSEGMFTRFHIDKFDSSALQNRCNFS